MELNQPNQLNKLNQLNQLPPYAVRRAPYALRLFLLLFFIVISSDDGSLYHNGPILKKHYSNRGHAEDSNKGEP